MSEEKICSICGKQYKKPTKYCSRDCYAKAPRTEETRSKMSKASKGKPKSLHMREALSKAIAGKPKPWQTGENNVNYKGKYTWDPLIREKFLESVKERGQAWTDQHKKDHSARMTGTNNHFYGKKHSAETKENISKVKIQQYKDGIIPLNLSKISKAEKEIHNYLVSLNINFKSQFHIPGVPYWYDFCLPNKQIIIEYQGDYWHANPIKYKPGTILNIVKRGPTPVEEIWKHDALKKSEAEKHGYKIIYIWETDYKSQGLQLVDDIISQIIY